MKASSLGQINVSTATRSLPVSSSNKCPLDQLRGREREAIEWIIPRLSTSYKSFLSIYSAFSIYSWYSVACFWSAFSLLTLGSAGSFLSLGSFLSCFSVGSTLSVSSIGSTLSVGCVGGFMQICY